MLSVQCGEWWLVDAVDRILNRPCDASLSERHAAVRVAADIVCCPADTRPMLLPGPTEHVIPLERTETEGDKRHVRHQTATAKGGIESPTGGF